MSAASPDAPDHDFVISRWLDAPRALVFKAWTDPRHMARWWGPADFTAPVCELDVRPGGKLRIVLRSADGVDFPDTGVFLDIVEPERLVYRQEWSERPEGFHALLREALGRAPTEMEAHITVTVTFEERAGRTFLTIRTRFESAEMLRAGSTLGMYYGWSTSLDKLDENLAVMAGIADRAIITSRLYDAPREMIWKAWTDPAQIVQWWGPNGFRNTTEVMDVRAGGQWKFIMHGPDGVDYPNLIRYIEVVKPERLVYTHEAPLFHVTVHFDDEGGKTRLRMRALWDTAEGRNEVAQKYGAIEGARQTLARLAQFLANEEIS